MGHELYCNARLIGSWLLRRYFVRRNGAVRPTEAAISGSLPRLAQLRKLLCHIQTSIQPSSNPDSHVGIIHVQNIPPMILLELWLIHEQGLGFAYASAISDVFPS